ncbi:hypothetical protein SADO_13373 [Salinisphaera dokdonensis CL-ES53]|uniref:Uncharacterized protein n=1 Tax=Salinisphaera dokdonensis CL-ES53 TaxID=1304272 RepID=A0ABV2B492_9GAMM
MNHDTPMAEVIAGMARAEHAACYEFVRRQTREDQQALETGAILLRDIATDLRARDVVALMAWKSPETYDPVPEALLKQALKGAAGNDTARVRGALEPMAFADLCAMATAADYLRQAAQHLRLYGGHGNAAKPQRELI